VFGKLLQALELTLSIHDVDGYVPSVAAKS